jgi:transposase
MDMLGKVRRMKLRDKLSISEIARRTGLSRNTVRGWLRAPGDVVPKYERRLDPRKITDYEPTLIAALKADRLRNKDARRTARALFVQITAQGYRGGYTQVTDFIRDWSRESGVSSKAFVPLCFENGEAFQFDWSEEPMLVGGIFYKVQVSHMKLCASRAFWLVAYPTQTHEMLFDAHTRSFIAFGGVPRRGIYDNMKTAVDKVSKGTERAVTARFKAMCSHYLFDADFCNVASGWEKGVVEKNVQDSRRRIWIEAAERRFGSFVELNDWLAKRCQALWLETAHPEHSALTVAEMLEIEREHLMAMPEVFDGYVEKTSRVSSTCLVSVARNRYSVPCEWAGKLVSTRLYPTQVTVAAGDTIVARHDRLQQRAETAYDWQHYIDLVQRKPGALRNGAPFLDMPEALLQLRQALMRYPGGDRTMADVLASVPRAGLDAVLTAVAITLEDVTPSGQVSIEHVENVLARLNSPPKPDLAKTDIELKQAPLANTARYDQLRDIQPNEQEAHHAP